MAVHRTIRATAWGQDRCEHGISWRAHCAECCGCEARLNGERERGFVKPEPVVLPDMPEGWGCE